jgi:methylglyoxal synthase
MKDTSMAMAKQKTIAIVAHDNKKQDLLAWAKFNRWALARHNLIATGTTGTLLHQPVLGRFPHFVLAHAAGVSAARS